ncbi:MAG TPA: AGE family epimerase/isomerase [Vicinamibacterales bacterium]|nr:AGE family epimerase/isomerase [Vicinamibacterales bacterium]
MSSVPLAEIRAWMFDAALPFWGTAGVDRGRGGFYEELDFAGRPTACDFKRTRAMCRQVYVFSHAAMLGWSGGADLSAWGYDYLVSRAWLGKDRGWARRLTAEGAPLDETPDLYDLAFVLFALAWRHRASGDADALKRAHDTLDFIEWRLRPPHGEGFLHQWPAELPRLQNPHMHLLEASLALEATSRDPRFRALAAEIVSLFRTRFFDGRTLAEYFTDDWRRASGEPGRIVEPGHQLEWAWILGGAGRLLGLDLREEANALVAFAERHGVDRATHVTVNQVRDDGAPIDAGSRTWPNTERIKGHLALIEMGGSGSIDAVAGSARLLLDRYLAVTPRGSWMDHFDVAGRPIASAAPTSTLYHVFLAFAEVLRLEAQLRSV